MGTQMSKPIRSVRGARWIGVAFASTLLLLLPTAAGAAPGDLDTGFGAGGMAIAGCDVWDDDYFGCSGGYEGRLYDVAVQADGRIVAAGARSLGAYGEPGFGLVRQLATGALDASFGDTGAVATEFRAPSVPYALALQADGRIVAAGTAGRNVRPQAFYEGGVSLTGGAQAGTTFALARYATDGSLDPSFGGDGKVRTRFGQTRSAAAYAVAVQPDGKVIAVGFAGRALALARYASDGTLDPSFGSNGTVRMEALERPVEESASDL